MFLLNFMRRTNYTINKLFVNYIDTFLYKYLQKMELYLNKYNMKS